MEELKVLLVEDSEKDAALILRELQRTGSSIIHRRVETAEDMNQALNEENWDVVLCDHVLPEFDGKEALQLLRRNDRDLPLIIVSGQIGEDVAVDAMKAGANDFVMKSNLKRLGPAVQREVREAREHRERHRVEEELRQTEEDLRVAKQVQLMKDEFIGMVSHELKSPLTVIIGALSVAGSEGVPPEEAADLVQDALTSANSLTLIIDNLLELSRYQKNRLALKFKSCDITDVVDTVVAKLQSRSRIHTLVKDVSADLPLAHADPLRVEHVLFNLVENAIKYSPGGGEVRISIKPDNSGLLVSVTDHGIGISLDDQKRLFQHFERLENFDSTDIEGVGLGLKVCQVLVEAHGGRIWLESVPGLGSTFFFTLPGGTSAETSG
jgi:signal transduction histidine kinase